MSGSFQMLLSGVQPRVVVVTTAGAGSTVVPVGYTKATCEAIGGGGNGFGSNTAGNRSSGGGGRYAISNARISVTAGASVFYSVGAAVTQSWVNTAANSAPTLATTGCLAPAGTSGTSGVAGLGSAGTAIGATTRNGGNGATGNNSAGGGGAGATTAGANPTAGTDTTGLSPAQLMGGGTGGAYNSGTGTQPGGGGGGAATTGTNLAGAIGRVRITFYP